MFGAMGPTATFSAVRSPDRACLIIIVVISSNVFCFLANKVCNLNLYDIIVILKVTANKSYKSLLFLLLCIIFNVLTHSHRMLSDNVLYEGNSFSTS